MFAQFQMDTERQIKELEKNQKRSARAIPVYLGFFIVEAGVLWTLSRLFTFSVWITIIVLGMTGFTLIGDIFNCYYCDRKLKTLKHDQGT